jgi:hypothetical protein
MGRQDGSKDSDQAKRARKLREAMGFATSLAFTQFLGVTNQRGNNVENGQPLGIDLALLVVQKTGVTLDWLYRGLPDGLTLDLARRLGALPGSEDPASRRGRR